MAISFSRPDPSSAAAVSAAQFSTSRKGFDQAEVRDFLRMVAAELARLQERERFLERELRSAQQINESVIDDETATRLLGEEAARILQTAREAAGQIRARAEDGSARLLREATDEAQRLREEAEIESARRRQDASADAEAEVQMAKQQGRDMVNEARSYRERVLSELARRRELARQQIEQLIHGRDRLLQAFERARLAAVDVMAELTPLGEPTEYVNLQPTTGPVPMMVPNLPSPLPLADDAGDLPATAAVALIEAPIGSPVMYDVAAEPADDDTATMEVVVEEETVEDDDTNVVAGAVEAEADEVVVSLPEPQPANDAAADDDREPAPVVALFSDGEPGQPAKGADTVDDLFARLRAARQPAVDSGNAAEVLVDDTDDEASVDEVIVVDAPDASGEESPGDETADTEHTPMNTIADVDELIVPLIVSASRKLKRALADEQNEVLDTLRRKEPVRSIDKLLPWEAEQSDRYATAVEADLIAAAVAGAQGGEDGANPAIVRPAHDAVTNEIVAPLRERLVRCIDRADGNNSDLANQVRSLYREWKTHRIDEHVEDIVRLAYDRGALTIASR